MKRTPVPSYVLAATFVVAASGCARSSGGHRLSFFVTSVGKGDGGNLGGLEGADRHCRQLAAALGVGERDWRAYLSAPAMNGRPAVNARDRIGPGPWFNAKGVRIAANVYALHGDNRISAGNSLNERGEPVDPHVHDILTGSTAEGALSEAPDGTCRGWTSNSAGRAVVGHHDRGGAEPHAAWNSAHWSSTCSARGLESTGGAGLFYCFAKE